MTRGAGIEKEIKRRADVVGIFPSEAAAIRLVGAVLLEINDEWATQNRYMQVEPTGDFVPAIDGEAGPADHTLIPPRAARAVATSDYTGPHCR